MRSNNSSLTLLKSVTVSITTSVSSLDGRPRLGPAVDFFLGALPLGDEKGDEFLDPFSLFSSPSPLRTHSSEIIFRRSCVNPSTSRANSELNSSEANWKAENFTKAIWIDLIAIQWDNWNELFQDFSDHFFYFYMKKVNN